MAILLFAFGVPSLIARAIHSRGDDVALAVMQGEHPSDDGLVRLDISRRTTAAWFPMNNLYNDLALVALERSGRAKDPSISKAYIKEAELWQRKALFISPADPYGWYRLAYLYYLTDGPSQRVADAWTQSLAVAPFEPRLLVPHLQMAMSLGDKIEEETRKSYPRLARDAWREDPQNLAKAAQDGSFVTIVEDALRNDPEDLQQFRALLDQKD